MGRLTDRFRKKKKPVDKPAPKFEEANDLKKLSLFITIVDNGFSKDITSIFKNYESGLQFIELGKGTAMNTVYDILGTVDISKEVIFSIVRNEFIDDLKKELDVYFIMHRKHVRGISMAIDMTSIVSVMAYKYLANI